MKKFAALVLVLIMCFSVSIGGTYAVQLGQTGALATDVFVTKSVGASIEIAEGQRIKLLPGATANGSAIQITTGADSAMVTLKFTVPTLNGEPIITVEGNGWTKNIDGTFTKILDAQKCYNLESFRFTLDSRVDMVDGKMVVVEKGKVKPLEWNGIETGYIKIEATTGVVTSGIKTQ